MATVEIKWQASDQLLLAEIAQTGKGRGPDRSLTIDLAEVAPAQRSALLALTKVLVTSHTAEPLLNTIDISNRPEPGTAERLARGMRSTIPLRLDAEPTLDQAISIAQEIAAERAAQQAEADQINAKQRAAQKIVAAASAQAQTEITALEKAGDLAGLRAYRLPTEIGDAWTTTARDAAEQRSRAIKDLEDAQRDRERQEWIAAHGSAHLQRCIAAGYDCKRLYVLERAALEAPGFTVDFGDKAAWKPRACPTTEGLDAEDAARALGLGEPQTVWLTTPAQDRVGDPEGYDYEEFAACEAVIIRGYLGKYDLVQIVAG
jgi:hypothetical protein